MRSASQFPQTVAVLATGLGVYGVGRGALLNNVVGSAVTAVQPASERLVDASPRHGSDAGVVIMLAAAEPPKTIYCATTVDRVSSDMARGQ